MSRPRQTAKMKKPAWSRAVPAADRVLFCTAWITLLTAVLLFLLCRRFPAVAHVFSKPCPILAATGLYCPGCGGVRALGALLRGKIGESFRYHPAVPCAAFYLLIYLGSHSLNRLTKGKTGALLFQNWHLYSFLALLLLQWILKNISGFASFWLL